MASKLGNPETSTPLSGSFGPNTSSALRARLYHIIFKANTPASKGFDVVLILVITASVITVMLESVTAVRLQVPELLRAAEWVFTILFTIEYLLRLWVVDRPSRYARSFFGVVDLLAVLPTYLSVLIPGAQYLLVVRLLRILRVFRVLKLAAYLDEADDLVTALLNSRRKIFIFVFGVLTVVVIFGSLMYLIEGEEHGFTSIPRSVYWAIVTLTTVGYGDISPQTDLGQTVAALIMIMGYGIIAVPTGIVTAELTSEQTRRTMAASMLRCAQCGHTIHDADAAFCKRCGTPLAINVPSTPAPEAPPRAP
ncbi:MAG: ion transporter [Rhodothermaceae bacterium]|nr:ion transporter [Rhodothermaceae bacterium]